jgi:hypothetical protein
MASTFSVSPSGKTVPQPEFAAYQAQLMAAFTDPEVLGDGVAIAGNGRLSMLRGRSEPIDWVRERMEIVLAPNAVISIKMTVPERFAKDAIEFVDYVLFRGVSKTARDAVRIPRSGLSSALLQCQTLEQSVATLSLRLAQARPMFDHTSAETAAIEETLRATQQRCAELDRDIAASQLIDEFMDQLRFVQTATVVGEPRKALFF